MKTPGNKTGLVCEQPSVPADPLLAGLVAGPSAAFNSAQAQRGNPG